MSRVLVGSALLVVLVACCAAASAAPAKPVRHLLVYSKVRSAMASIDTARIWRARIDGRHPQSLGPGSDPAVSPDGRWIAFGRGRQILVVPTEGGTPRRVYELHRGQPALAGAPVWAPNSRAFGVSDGVGIAVVNPSPRTARVLRLAAAGGFAFSPDSRRIAYESSGNIYVVSAGGGKPQQLTRDHKAYAPVWGKTGIAFTRFTHGAHGDVWMSDGRPRHARQLTHTGAAFLPAFFSADGTRLLAANPATHNGRLWAVDVRTGNARPLTQWFGDLVPQG